MAMNDTYLNFIRDAAQAELTRVGLVNAAGVEVASGGYARQSVTWVDEAGGVMRISGDVEFTMTSGDEVGGWRAYNEGGTEYGGGTLPTVNFSLDGTYTLLAGSGGTGTFIDHSAS